MAEPPKATSAEIEASPLLKEMRQRMINIEAKLNILLRREVYLTPRDVSTLMDDLGDQRYGSRTYAQHGDDLVLLNIFDMLRIPRPTYLDIGAHDPFKISNTTLLYHRGSRGINVDANPNLIAAFKVQRPHDINLNVGVAGTAGAMTFYMFGDMSGLNTFDPVQAQKIEASGQLKVQNKIEIPVITVPMILAEHCPSGFPDLLSVDIEGLDLEILKSIDYTKTIPKVICVEANSPEHGRETAAFLESVGYTLYFRAFVNMFFVRSELLGALRP